MIRLFQAGTQCVLGRILPIPDSNLTISCFFNASIQIKSKEWEFPMAQPSAQRLPVCCLVQFVIQIISTGVL